jgi:hypothetical protein
LSPSACLVDGLARQRDRQDRGSGTWPRRPLGADFREGGLGRLAVSGGGPESSNRRARGPASGRSPPPSLPRAWRRSGAGRGIRNRWPGCSTGPGSTSTGRCTVPYLPATPPRPGYPLPSADGERGAGPFPGGQAAALVAADLDRLSGPLFAGGGLLQESEKGRRGLGPHLGGLSGPRGRFFLTRTHAFSSCWQETVVPDEPVPGPGAKHGGAGILRFRRAPFGPGRGPARRSRRAEVTHCQAFTK